MQHLPQEFVDRIARQLGAEASAFFRTYDEPRTNGLRLNSAKIAPGSPAAQELAELFTLAPVPWCPQGFYYDPSSRPGKHPYYAAGLYYIQEPSAMLPVELLDPKPGETILDLAAAPGGKATQIADKLQGQGLLVANEIHPARAKILSENIERAGITNAIVLNSTPDELAQRFSGRFDRILLDAPCSGEGMFRKDPETVNEWSLQHVRLCAARQADILDRAAALLKPGGTLVYSTCTFNREENEETIAAFLDRHPEFVCRATERLWPHRQRGEGHFAALLYKEDLAAASNAQTPPQHAATRGAGRPAKRKDRQAAAVSRSEWAEFQAFAESAMPGFILPPGEPVRFGDAVYWLPDPGSRHFPPHTWTGLKVLRPGLHLFDVRKGRIEPAHALAMALTGADFRAVSRPPEDPFIAAYLRGESVPAPPGCPDGRVIVAVNGFPLGWGKTSNGQIKNHLPKALRRHIGE